MDKIIFTGGVGKNPERKTTKGGTELVQLDVAVNHYANGEKTTEWRQVTAFGKTADYAEKYIEKGMKVLVEGYPKARAYKNRLEETVAVLDITASSIEITDWGKHGEQDTQGAQEQLRTDGQNELEPVDTDSGEPPF